MFSANRGYGLRSSRTTIIEDFLNSGWKVVIAATVDQDSLKLTEIGVELEEVRFSRGAFSPKHDFTTPG